MHSALLPKWFLDSAAALEQSKELSCSAADPSCEMYRQTAAGKALYKALHEMVGDDRVPPTLAATVMKAFDRCMYVAFERDFAENGAQTVKINPKVRPPPPPPPAARARCRRRSGGVSPLGGARR